MAFIAKPDYFGLASGDIKVKSSDENRTASRVTAPNNVGDVVASEEYGETSAPTAEYVAGKSLAAWKATLGSVKTVGSKNYVLTSLAVTKRIGSATLIRASGVEVPDGAKTPACTCEVSISAEAGFHGEILMGAFTVSGTNTTEECALVAECDFHSESINGEIVAWDISNPRLNVNASIRQTSAAPVLTPGESWKCVAPLSTSNPDAEYPLWTVGFTKDLAVTEAGGGS